MYATPTLPNAEPEPDGLLHRNVFGSYYHLHFASNALLAPFFIDSVLNHSPSNQNKIRAISFVSTATEIVFALKCEHLLFGVTSLCDYPSKEAVRSPPRQIVSTSLMDASTMTSEEVAMEMQRLKEKQQHESALWNIDIDAVKEIRPTIIFTQSTCVKCDTDSDSMQPFLSEDDDCDVVDVSPRTLEEMLKAIQTIAIALHVSQQGYELVSKLRSRLDNLSNSMRSYNPTKADNNTNTKPLRVLSLEGLAPLCTGGHWLPDVKRMAGCVDAFDDVGGAPARILSWDDIQNANPDVLLLCPCSSSPERTLKELHLLDCDSFWKLKCVQQGQVYLMDHGKFSRPGPRLIDAVEMLVALLYNLVVVTPGSSNDGEHKLWEDGEVYKLKISPSKEHFYDLASCFEPLLYLDFLQHCNIISSIYHPQQPFLNVSNEKNKLDALPKNLAPSPSSLSSPHPSPRCAHCLISIESNNYSPYLLLLTGEDQTSRRLCDVWKLSQQNWEFIPCKTVASEEDSVPTKRSNAAAVNCANNFVLVFGGWGDDNVTPLSQPELLHLDTWCWTHCSTRGEAGPSARGNPTLVYNPRTHDVLSFGGWDGKIRYNDLWSLDLITWTWKRIQPYSLIEPQPRTDHTANLWQLHEKEYMLIFGGTCDGGASNDLWSWNSCTNEWQELCISGSLPPPRTSHTAALVSRNDSSISASLIIVGGTNASIGSGKRGLLCDAWVLDLSCVSKAIKLNSSWMKLDWDGYGVERCRHAMAMYPAKKDDALRIAVWGGYDGESVIEEDKGIVWSFQFQPRTQEGDNSSNTAIKQEDTDKTIQPPARTKWLKEKWEAETPYRETDLPPQILQKAKRSTLPNALSKTLHRYAVENRRDTYIDPATGYSVFTRLFLERRPCCGNGCRHCPYGHINVPGRKQKGFVKDDDCDDVSLDW